MVVLGVIGSITERLYGSIAFILLYLVSGIGGNVASLFLTVLSNSAGASGAIMGIIGACIPFMLNKKLILPQRLKQTIVILIFVFSSVIFFSGFIVDFIDNAGHIGGFLTGFGTGFILRRILPARGKGEERKKYAVVAGIGILIFIIGIAGGNFFLKPIVPLLKIYEYVQKLSLIHI